MLKFKREKIILEISFEFTINLMNKNYILKIQLTIITKLIIRDCIKVQKFIRVFINNIYY